MSDSTYKFINDEQQLLNFIDWLPELEKEECYYVALIARKKYDTNKVIKTNQTCIKRFISSKDHLFQSIRSLEVKYGTYKVNDKLLDESILSLYILPNPRSFRKASIQMAYNVLNTLSTNEEFKNPKSIIMSELSKHPNRKIFLDVDIDLYPDQTLHIEELYILLNDIINEESIVNIVQTRGGYHLLIKPDLISHEFQKTYYKSISNIKDERIKDVSIKGDRFLPIPGTIQGGFVPKMILHKK